MRFSLVWRVLGCAPLWLTACDGDVTLYIGTQRSEITEAGAAASTAPDGDVAVSDMSAQAEIGPGGCGREHAPGIDTIEMVSNDEERAAHVVVPRGYDPRHAHPVVFAFHARNETGLGAHEEFGLESIEPSDWALFVYPDALVRLFNGDDLAAGWQNGPSTDYFGGTLDVEFTLELVASVGDRYCVDADRLFVTGHGWGGDFSGVLGCYAGDVFRAFAQVGANRPYFLPVDADDTPPCTGEASAWILHGKGDEYFPLDFGRQHVDFWSRHNECAEASPLQVEGARQDDECASLACERSQLNYCWYASEDGHELPPYYARAVVEFFREF